MSLIAVDLTPLLPGGANGGAKIMTLRLLKHLAKLAPDIRFILISTQQNLPELSSVFKEYPNVDISLVEEKISRSFKDVLYRAIKSFTSLTKSAAHKVLPLFLKEILTKRLRPVHFPIQNQFFTKKLPISKPDLLFCPFTAPFFHQPGTPTVSVIYDLQYHYYPFFFTKEERVERKKHFEAACKLSSKLICISDFVNQTVLDNSKLSSKNVITVHIKAAYRLPQLPPSNLNESLKSLNLSKENFLLYPANFWAHKNHSMLLSAFAAYCAKNSHSTLKLVCTGADDSNKQLLQKAIIKMGLSDRIILPGYLSNTEFSALMKGCLAMIFPSLYEGFGMPLLEAMAAGKPVLCSNVTSLPEVAGGAALLFDPRKPQDIVKAIYQIEHEPDLVNELIRQGQERAAYFGREEVMAKEYLEVFRSVMKSEKNKTSVPENTGLSSQLRISVITPSYNQGQFIERTIQSVLSQNIPNLEYFIADGGSTDHTLQVLQQYDQKIRWISEQDKGQAHAVNKGILQTTGDIIGWVNSDDIYYPSALQTVLQYFSEHPEIDVVYGNAYHIDTKDQILETYYTETWKPERLKEVCYLCQPAVFFRRKVVEQHGLLNENLQYCMDYEFWLRLCKRKVNFAYLPQLLAGSRLYSETKTLGARVKVHQEINDMMKQTFHRVPDRWLSNYAHVVVESLYDRHESPNQFKKDIAVQAIQASFRWNKGISPALLTLTLSWLMRGIFSKQKVAS